MEQKIWEKQPVGSGTLAELCREHFGWKKSTTYEVFQHGFSHGTTGNKLKEKKLVASFTTGAPEFMYSYEGAPKYPIEDFLPPIKAMCNLCQMNFAGYVYTGGVSYQSREDSAKLAEMKEKSAAYADRVIDLLDTL